MSQSTIVIFGATGDLTRRKLVPALYNLRCKGVLPETTHIVGFSIEDYTDDTLRERLQGGVQEFSPKTYADEDWATFAPNISYVQGNLTEVDTFRTLEQRLQEIEDGPSDRLYYFAISPTFYPVTAANLGAAGMAEEANGLRNIIVEKPFGRDLETACALNDQLQDVFAERQIYRIDHYLGKETAQNVLFFRFANHVFESVWNRDHIDNVQITVAETVDVGHRAAYYDKAGVVRDMIQNHLLQLVTLVAMEPPHAFNAEELRNEKVKVLRSIRQIDFQDAVRGQYKGYLETDGVVANSETPTYAAMKLYIDNWRWQGVPFYLRTGKALETKVSEVTMQFKRPPRAMFQDALLHTEPNLLSLCIQPDEGIHFKFDTKVPGNARASRTTDMEFHYDDHFGDNAIPEAYERLLLDALQGDASLFIRSDEIETAWSLVDPIIKTWEDGRGSQMQSYKVGSWGPTAADALLARDGNVWQLGCMHE